MGELILLLLRPVQACPERPAQPRELGGVPVPAGTRQAVLSLLPPRWCDGPLTRRAGGQGHGPGEECRESWAPFTRWQRPGGAPGSKSATGTKNAASERACAKGKELQTVFKTVRYKHTDT